MINGEMAEAQKGFATLQEVDEGTFARFIEWAYKGYYTAAGFEVETSGSASPVPSMKEECESTEWTEPALVEEVFLAEEAPLVVEESPAEESPSYRVSAPPSFGYRTFSKVELSSIQAGQIDQKAKTSSELKESFLRRRYTVRREVISIPPTRANREAHEDYTEVLLSHARLYVFAEKYDIQPLKTLALEELHSTLAIYTLYPQRTGDIVALLRYVYANTGAPTRGGDDLRTLLRDYIGYEMRVLMKDEEFIDLMIEDAGALLRDFMKMVAKRIT